MYVFRGTYNAADGSVNVTSGNGRVRKHGFVGQIVQFSYTNAKFNVADCPATTCPADTDNVGNDVQSPADSVLVQAKLPNKDPGAQPFAARKLIDKTHPPV